MLVSYEQRIIPTSHIVRGGPHGLPADLLQDIVKTFKALSDPTRAQIVFLLTRREYSVNEVSERVPVSASGVSHHLARLRAIRLVNARRAGNQIFYVVHVEPWSENQDEVHAQTRWHEPVPQPLTE